MKKSKNDVAWKKLFDKYDTLNESNSICLTTYMKENKDYISNLLLETVKTIQNS